MKSLLRVLLVLIVGSWSESARADIVFSTDSATISAGGTGFLELFVDRDPNSATNDRVASYSFRLSSPNSGIHFTSGSTTGLTQPYLFDSTGGALFNFDSVNSIVSDGSSSTSSSPIGSPFSLARIGVSVDAGTQAGDYGIVIDQINVQFARGDSAVSSATGVLHVTSDNTPPVPAPASAIALMSGAGLVLGFLRRKAN